MPDSFFSQWEQSDLSKGAASPESQAAFDKLKPHLADAQRELLDWLREQGDWGGTCREYAAAKGVGMNCVSGRWSELKAMGRIRHTGKRRDGCAVYVATEVQP